MKTLLLRLRTAIAVLRGGAPNNGTAPSVTTFVRDPVRCAGGGHGGNCGRPGCGAPSYTGGT